MTPNADYGAPEWADLAVCNACGAVVQDRATHDRFHSVLSSHAWAIAVLKTSHIAAHVHDRYDVAERMDRRKFDNWSADALAEVVAEMDAGLPPNDGSRS